MSSLNERILEAEKKLLSMPQNEHPHSHFFTKNLQMCQNLTFLNN